MAVNVADDCPEHTFPLLTVMLHCDQDEFVNPANIINRRQTTRMAIGLCKIFFYWVLFNCSNSKRSKLWIGMSRSIIRLYKHKVKHPWLARSDLFYCYSTFIRAAQYGQKPGKDTYHLWILKWIMLCSEVHIMTINLKRLYFAVKWSKKADKWSKLRFTINE